MIGQIQPKTFIVHKLHTKSIRNQNNLFIAKEKQSKNYHGLSKMFRFSLFTYEILVALLTTSTERIIASDKWPTFLTKYLEITL